MQLTPLSFAHAIIFGGALCPTPSAGTARTDDEVPIRPAVVRFVIDSSASEVGFDGTSTLHDFTGRTHDVTGEVFADPAHPTEFASGRVECKAESLDTDNDSRDEKMREHLDVVNFPTISFTLANAEGERKGANEVDVAGSFAIHGVQREYHITLTSEVAADGSLHVRGRLPLKLRDHGIVPPAVMLIEVGELVQVWFDLKLDRAKEVEIDARAYRLSVSEHSEPAAGAPSDEQHQETYFASAEGALWERASDGLWLVEDAAAQRRCVELATNTVRARVLSADESFAEARGTMQRLQEKLDKLEGPKRERAERAVAETRAKLEAVLVHAPAAGPLVRTKVDDGEVWTLGGTTWLELHGRRGEDSSSNGGFAALLGCLEGLPDAVRTELPTLTGVPERCMVRTATMGGVRTLAIEVGAAAPGRLPRRALEIAGGATR
jgi:polyisoprenoid-binding protein YceI